MFRFAARVPILLLRFSFCRFLCRLFSLCFLLLFRCFRVCLACGFGDGIFFLALFAFLLGIVLICRGLIGFHLGIRLGFCLDLCLKNQIRFHVCLILVRFLARNLFRCLFLNLFRNLFIFDRYLLLPQFFSYILQFQDLTSSLYQLWESHQIHTLAHL